MSTDTPTPAWAVLDIACTAVLGVFPTEEEAQRVADAHPECLAWVHQLTPMEVQKLTNEQEAN